MLLQPEAANKQCHKRLMRNAVDNEKFIQFLEILHPQEVVALHFKCAIGTTHPTSALVSCPSFPLADDLPTKAEEHPLLRFY